MSTLRDWKLPNTLSKNFLEPRDHSDSAAPLARPPQLACPVPLLLAVSEHLDLYCSALLDGGRNIALVHGQSAELQHLFAAQVGGRFWGPHSSLFRIGALFSAVIEIRRYLPVASAISRGF